MSIPSSRWVLLLLLSLVICAVGAASAQADVVIYNSWNGDGTYSNPPILPVFTLDKPTTITTILNYHWNGWYGQDASLVNGWIGIEQILSETESVSVGRWPAVSGPGAFGSQNTQWYAYPNTVLGPGTFKVVDSNRETWSYTVSDYYHYIGVTGKEWEPYKGFSMIFAADSFVDVRLIDTIPTQDVEFVLSSVTRTPYAVSQLADKTIVEWRYPNFARGQAETISFDLDLHKLVPGENRLIDHKLEVIYTDLNGNEVRYELPPLHVHVLNSAFNSAISIDRSTYKANEDVVISANIKNLSEYERTIDAKILIEDNQGSLVKEITTLSNLNFTVGETKNFGNPYI